MKTESIETYSDTTIPFVWLAWPWLAGHWLATSEQSPNRTPKPQPCEYVNIARGER